MVGAGPCIGWVRVPSSEPPWLPDPGGEGAATPGRRPSDQGTEGAIGVCGDTVGGIGAWEYGA